jgi:hypothetical protein
MSGSGIGDPGPDDQPGADKPGADKPAWRGLKRPGNAAGKPSRIGAAGRRAQQVARDSAADKARKVKEAALPRLSQATDEVRRRAAANSEATEQVTVALLLAASTAAGAVGKTRKAWPRSRRM